jgi:hypothetical protein
MLNFLHDKASPRKLRLFGCACCRALWPRLTEEWGRRAVEVAEDFADALAGEPERAEAEDEAMVVNGEATRQFSNLQAGADEAPPWWECEASRRLHWAAIWIVKDPPAVASVLHCLHDAAGVLDRQGAPGETSPVADSRLAALAREVFGNPFRPVAVEPSWRSPDVAALAEAAYQERSLPAGTLDGARLAVLADALEDAGCTSADLLDHLRDRGPHVRSCWAVDAVTGRG